MVTNEYVTSILVNEDELDTRLNEYVFDRHSTVLVVCFIPSIYDFEGICKKVKEFFADNCSVVGVTTAGELCSVDKRSVYCKDSKIIITSFSSKLFKNVELFSVRLFGNDIREGEVILEERTRIELIEQEIDRIKLKDSIDYRKSFVYALLDSSSNSEGFFIDAFYRAKKFPCPIVGGSSGSYDFNLKSNRLFFDGKVVNDRAILIYCTMQKGLDYCLFKSRDFKKVDRVFEVLKGSLAERYISDVLDNQNNRVNIITFLTNYFDCKESELEERLKRYAFGLFISEKEYIRSIKQIDFKNRRVYFFSDFAFSDSVYLFEHCGLMHNTKEDLKKFLKNKPKPIFAIFNDCILRRVFNKNELDSIGELPDIDMVGFSTFGEIFGVNVNQTLSAIFFFKESDKLKERKDGFIVDYAEYCNFFTQRFVSSSGSRRTFENYEKLEKLVDQLKESNRKIEKISKHKSEFLSNMSHEIRTPLNAILGFVQVLKEQERDEVKLKYLDIVVQSSKHLLSVINDILDFSKIESGKLQIDSIDFSSDEFELVYQLFLAKAKEKKINFRFEISKDFPKYLYGDIFRIRQVIVNLLGNAFKFTDDGKSIFYTVEWVDNQLVVAVEDEGKGIAQEKIGKIFKSFTQEDNSTTREYGGSGLGLTISSKLVEMMGGKIKVNSSLGVGSRFEVIIPLKLGNRVEEKKRLVCDSDFTGKKILVAEDNASNRMFIEVLFKKYDIDLEFAHDGLEAVEKFKSREFDLIFMDENMPNMSGVDATKKILEIEKENNLDHTPIVALTANALSGDEKRFLDAGMDAYLSKPIDKDKIYEVFEKYLKK